MVRRGSNVAGSSWGYSLQIENIKGCILITYWQFMDSRLIANVYNMHSNLRTY